MRWPKPTLTPLRGALLRASAVAAVAAVAVAANATLVFPRIIILSPPWGTYAGNPQHTGISQAGSALPQQILWSDDIDPTNPEGAGGELFVHYGSPVISKLNTVVFPVTTSVASTYAFRARNGATGTQIWQFNSDYTLCPGNWTPVVEGSIVLANSYAMPGIGGSVYLRESVDAATSPVHQYFFYGNATHTANQAWADANIKICTPIMADPRGNMWFGYYVGDTNTITSYVGGSPPAALAGLGRGGIVRLTSSGVGTYVTAATACQDATVNFTAVNCAPALSNDGSAIYIAVTRNYYSGNYGGLGARTGYLVKLNSMTLSTLAKAAPINPVSSMADGILVDTSGTPTVGPDGDVYWGTFGINGFSVDYRESHGWMHHFDSNLNDKAPGGAFGWDDTATIVPASMVPSYSGTSSYLILTKYNNYAWSDFAGFAFDTGADGQNLLAVIDPNDASGVDRQSGHACCKPVITVVGLTPDAENPLVVGAVREWCINSAAIDPTNKCAVVNSEDGRCYRWDFTSNSLTPVVSPGVAGIFLNSPTGEAYTPTVIGPDGTIYAINAHKVYAITHL